MIVKCFIFQHGNNPKHTVNTVKPYLDRNVHSEILSVFQSQYQSLIGFP